MMMETNSVRFFKDEKQVTIEHPPIVVAWQVKNPENVGSLMRIIDNVGGCKLILLDDANNKRESSIKKTAGISYNNIELEYSSSEDFFKAIPKDYTLCAVETCTGATNIYKTPLPNKVIFFIGSETKGIPPELLSHCKQSVYIPMVGKCKSMNISQALSVSLFEWLRQHFFA